MITSTVPNEASKIKSTLLFGLSTEQSIFILAPLFFGVGLMYIAPETGQMSFWKMVATAIFTVICLTLSIEIKGRTIRAWIAMLVIFKARGRYYVVDSSSNYLRQGDYSKRAKKQVVAPIMRKSLEMLVGVTPEEQATVDEKIKGGIEDGVKLTIKNGKVIVHVERN